MTGTLAVDETTVQDIDGLLWYTKWGTPSLTYSFPTNASYYEGAGEAQNNFEAFSDAQIAAVQDILDGIASATNLSFTEIAETAAIHATLRLALSDTPPGAWAYLPEIGEAAGDSWYNNSGGAFDHPARGNYAYYSIMHEIGHSLGLKHGHDPSVFGPMTTARDSMEYSIMTYRSYVGADGAYVYNEPSGYAQTLMLYDIAALQHLYGADFSTNSGNTTYRWDSLTGQAFVDGVGQGIPENNRVFMTLWDGGGNDTYDFSDYADNLTVDMRPGKWVTTSPTQLADLGHGHYARGNIANALLYKADTRSLIENARGGSGDDKLIGNQGANRLSGSSGDDTLTGGLGNDVFVSGPGRDRFVFNTLPDEVANLDRIVDFNVKDDTIRLDNAVFTAVGKTGRLSSTAFWNEAAAHDKSDRILYDKGSGSLYYDPDGIGQAAQVEFAHLARGLKLHTSDFYVV
ncbi:M10 family metallopeptidase [Microvirga arabica]|uniref:M10 family metallopeptidase n=1 Tax=Microvirga arabica TaxID=1128671 RepID=UPI0019394B13|nr:M10 family metallopeptidase [Microvirga arabica]MBM1174571.1 M10 family metallopeptidase [Microvirga arabica]